MDARRLALAALLVSAPVLAQGPSTRSRPPSASHTPARPQASAPQQAPAPQVAQPPPAPPTPAEAAVVRCRALLPVAMVPRGPDKVEALADGGCRFEGVRFGFTSLFGYEVADLVEHGVPSGMPDGPVSMQVEARGITVALGNANPKAAFISREQQVPFDVTFDGSFDPGAQEVVVRNLALDGAALGHTSLAMELTGTDPRSFPDRAGLRSLRFHMDSRRFLLNFVFVAAVMAMPDEGDPATNFERMKAEAATRARALLAMTGAAPDTVEAIASFIADFPHPQHVLDLTITASPPLLASAVGRLLDAAPPDPAALATLLRTVTVTSSYTAEPR